MKKCLLVVLALLANIVLVGCADEQARTQISDLNTRVSQLEANVSAANNRNSSQKSIDVLNKLDDLQNQINQINGNVSTVTNNQKTYQSTQEQLNQSLQQQLQSLEKPASTDEANAATGGAVVATAGATKATASAGANNAKAANLKTALKKMKKHDFPGAIVVLKKIIVDKDNNSKDTIAHANYYLSIAYAANNQFKESILTAKRYIAENPNGKNVPDELRIIYISQSQLGLKKSAARTANLLVKEYPDSDAAKRIKAE